MWGQSKARTEDGRNGCAENWGERVWCTRESERSSGWLEHIAKRQEMKPEGLGHAGLAGRFSSSGVLPALWGEVIIKKLPEVLGLK